MYDNEVKLMTRIAILFYEEGYTQEEIGRMLGMSRLQVHRRLRTAVDTGVVRIKIDSEIRDYIILENKLRKYYNLDEVVIVESTDNTKKNKEHIAYGAANLLVGKLQDSNFVGVSWGSTVSMIPEFLPQKDVKDVKVGNIVGGISNMGDLGAQQVAMKIAMKLKATPKLLSLPFMVESVATKNIIFDDEYIKQDIQSLKKCDICVVGIGHVGQNFSYGFIKQYEQNFNSDKKNDVSGNKSVGEIVGRYFDIDGNVTYGNPGEDRIIGLTLDDIRKVPVSIGAAGGVDKCEAIIGALRGKYINCLVTDQDTAEAIISMEESMRKE